MSAAFTPPPGFRLMEREAWAAIGRGRAPADAGPPATGPVDAVEWTDIYVPLAHVIGLHIDARSDLYRHLAAAGLPGTVAGPCIIGLAGSVAAGKSTFSTTLAALLAARPDRPSVEVLSTDGFLLPNAVLIPRGRVGNKGFPDTYDNDLADRVLGGLAQGEAGLTVPRYSHEHYDIVEPPIELGTPDIVILEGVNALGHPVDFCTLRIYLDVDESSLRQWYVTRFLELIDDARARPESFFAQWTGLTPVDAEALAAAVWDGVNLVNLTEHIVPTRWRADFVVRKGADHRATAVAVRSR